MQVITVDSVTPKEGTRPWKIHDGSDEYVTWDDGDGALLKALEGMTIEVEIEKRMKHGEGGKTFVNKVITEVHAPEANGQAAPAHREGEPNVNTAKQIVIIRQNAWAQTNDLYATALAFLKMTGHDPETLTGDQVEAAANELLPGMTKIAKQIEKTIRRDWFPEDEIEEVPF